MQLYLAIAGVALLFALSEFMKASPYVANTVSGYKIMGFVEVLNENILSGNSTFVAYLPSGICNASIVVDAIETRYGSFATAGNVSVENSSFCPDGVQARLYLSYGQGGGVVVSR